MNPISDQQKRGGRAHNSVQTSKLCRLFRVFSKTLLSLALCLFGPKLRSVRAATKQPEGNPAMSGSQGFQSFQRSLRIGRPSWVASPWFAPADTVQKLVEQQIENGWLKIENSKFLKIGHKVLGACTRALPAPYPCSRLSLKARRPRPQLQFKHLILRVCQSAGGRALTDSNTSK